jgi:hypothetical protein
VLAIPPVDESAGRQVDQEIREAASEADDAGLRGRAGQREDEEREREPTDLGAECGDDLPAPEQDEVPVAPEWRRR